MGKRSEFFNYDFVNFILINRNFFKNYKKRFVSTFNDYLQKLGSSRVQKEELEKFYERLFISPFLQEPVIDLKKELAIIWQLQKYNIDPLLILNRLFLLMSNAYIKEILKDKNSIEKLKTFTLLCNFYIEYIRFHSSSQEEEETLSIPNEIVKLYENKEHLNLFSIYKGIPIAHKTQILSIDTQNSTIEVSANRYQLVAAKFHKEIFLLQNDKEYSYRAVIANIRNYKKHLILKNIEKKQRNAPKRNFIRIQPKEKIEVTIKTNRSKFSSYIYDLSLRGMCLISSKKLPLEISDFITLEFYVRLNGNNLIKTSGEIKSITKIDSKTFKYHIEFKIDSNYEKILEKYITKREKEIIKELNSYIQKEFLSLIE